MIRVWRLCQTAHQTSAFSGEGAGLYGGRWNRKGQPAIYTAATQSLAALEILIHVDTDLVPNDFVAFAVDLPEDLVEAIDPGELPSLWREQFPPVACQTLGGLWLEQGRSAVLAVPSAIIPSESNYILNPKHAAFDRIAIHPPQSFSFDQRLWRL